MYFKDKIYFWMGRQSNNISQILYEPSCTWITYVKGRKSKVVN